MGLFSSIGKAIGSIAGGLFGKGPKIKYPDASKTIIPRDEILSKFYSDYFAPYGLGIYKGDDGKWHVDEQFLEDFKGAKQDYLAAAKDYADKVGGYADYLSRLLPAPSFFQIPSFNVQSPIGNLPAYGLQRAALRNKAGYLSLLGNTGQYVGLLSGLMKNALLPAQLEYQLNYLQPLNLFTQQDLARYRVQAQPYGISASPGLLGYAMASFAQPLGSWAFDKFKNWWG